MPISEQRHLVGTVLAGLRLMPLDDPDLWRSEDPRRGQFLLMNVPVPDDTTTASTGATSRVDAPLVATTLLHRLARLLVRFPGYDRTAGLGQVWERGSPESTERGIPLDPLPKTMT